ncbi:MAG TPA: hypothetical protein PK583_02085, partial [Gammaproteobacteria bacterium]|nr:hypothetical protein [Gammaproteobacteria bacterium]
MSTSTEDPRLKVIVEGALTSEHPLVKQGMDEEQILRQRTQAEIQELLSKTVRALNQAENIKAIKTKTLKQIDLDLALAGILNTSLVPYKTSVHPGVGQGIYPLKSNKLVPILTGVKEFLNTSFTKLFEYQEIPRGYRFVTNPTDVTRLGPNKYRIYGDSKNTVLKTALLETYLAATGKTV